MKSIYNQDLYNNTEVPIDYKKIFDVINLETQKNKGGRKNPEISGCNQLDCLRQIKDYDVRLRIYCA